MSRNDYESRVWAERCEEAATQEREMRRKLAPRVTDMLFSGEPFPPSVPTVSGPFRGIVRALPIGLALWAGIALLGWLIWG